MGRVGPRARRALALPGAPLAPPTFSRRWQRPTGNCRPARAGEGGGGAVGARFFSRASGGARRAQRVCRASATRPRRARHNKRARGGSSGAARWQRAAWARRRAARAHRAVRGATAPRARQSARRPRQAQRGGRGHPVEGSRPCRGVRKAPPRRAARRARPPLAPSPSPASPDRESGRRLESDAPLPAPMAPCIGGGGGRVGNGAFAFPATPPSPALRAALTLAPFPERPFAPLPDMVV